MTDRLKISRKGLELIKGFEGFRPQATKLANGNWIVGYGHTRSAHEGKAVSESDAESLLQYDLQEIENAVNSRVLTPISQNQFDALISFVFNIGVSNFETSDVLRNLNEGHVLRAAEGMEKWRKARVGGDLLIVDALVRRRAAEKSLFLTPDAGHRAASSFEVRPAMDLNIEAEDLDEAPSRDSGVVEGSLAPAAPAQPIVETSAPTTQSPSAKRDDEDQSRTETTSETAAKKEPASDLNPDAKSEDTKSEDVKTKDIKEEGPRFDDPISPAPTGDMPAGKDNVVTLHDKSSEAKPLASGVSKTTMTDSETEVMDRTAASAETEATDEDVPETSQEEILDIVRRIREMTQNAPKVATYSEEESSDTAVAEAVEPEAPSASVAKAEAKEAPKEPTPSAVQQSPAVETPKSDDSRTETAASHTPKEKKPVSMTVSDTVRPLTGSGFKIPEGVTPSPAHPPAPQPQTQPKPETVVEESVIAVPAMSKGADQGPDPMLVPAAHARADDTPKKKPVQVIRRDPDAEIPAEGLMAPMFEGDEVFDLSIVHDAPPVNTGQDDIIFLGDDVSRYTVVGALLGACGIVLGTKNLMGGTTSAFAGVIPLMLGVLLLAASGYFIFKNYQKYTERNSKLGSTANA